MVLRKRRADAEQFDPKDPEEEEQVQEDYKGPPGPHRRRVIKPILRLAKFKGSNESRQQYTVQDVRDAITKVRKEWKIKKLLQDGKTPVQVSKLWDGELKERIHVLFPRQAQFSREKRKNVISMTFFRNVYGNYAYQTLADSNRITRSMWPAQHLGWKPSSSWSVDKHKLHWCYNVKLLPTKLPKNCWLETVECYKDLSVSNMESRLSNMIM